MDNISINIESSGSFNLRGKIKELWLYKELFYFLTLRDIKVRYKQTLLGVGWAVVRPFASMIVFTFVFNKLAGFSDSGIPYSLITFSAIIAWNFFSEGLSGSTTSLISNSNLVTKIYLPRVILPSSSVLKGILDLLIAFVFYLFLLLYYNYNPGFSILLFPLLIPYLIIASLGLGFWFSALSIKYRDIAQALPFIIQIMFWVSPVGYTSDKIPAAYQIYYWLNPVTGVLEIFRYSLTGLKSFDTNLLYINIAVNIVIFISGYFFFSKTEKYFSDLI